MNRVDIVGKSFFGGGKISLVTSTIPISSSDPIEGTVYVSVEERTYIRGVWIKLAAKNRIFFQLPNGGPVKKRVDMLKGEEDYQKEAVYQVFLGFGEHDPDGGQLCCIEPGNHSWSFSFNPLNAINGLKPLSYCDRNAETAYVLTATFDTPAFANTITQVVHYVNIGHHSRESLAADSLYQNIHQYPPSSLLGKNDIESISMTKNQLFSCMNTSRTFVLEMSPSSTLAVYPFKVTNTSYKTRCRLDGYKLSKDKNLVLKAELIVAVLLRVRTDVPFCIAHSRTKYTETILHSLWKSEKKFISAIDSAKQLVAEFLVPIQIDPTEKIRTMNEWPKPSTIAHNQSKKILDFTQSTFLHEYRVFLKVSVMEQQVHSGLDSMKDSTSQICDPCYAEIFIQPPFKSAEASNATNPTASLAAETIREPDVVHSSHQQPIESNANNPQPSVTHPSMLSAPKTPHAVLAVTRVHAEAVSYGPAALLVDRMNPNGAEIQFQTPMRFASLHHVGIAEAIEGTPMFATQTPAMAEARYYQSTTPRYPDNSNIINGNIFNNQNITTLNTITPRPVVTGIAMDSPDGSVSTISTASQSLTNTSSSSVSPNNDEQSQQSVSRSLVTASNIIPELFMEQSPAADDAELQDISIDPDAVVEMPAPIRSLILEEFNPASCLDTSLELIDPNNIDE